MARQFADHVFLWCKNTRVCKHTTLHCHVAQYTSNMAAVTNVDRIASLSSDVYWNAPESLLAGAFVLASADKTNSNVNLSLRRNTVGAGNLAISPFAL